MRARKISPKTRYLYHYTLKSNVESILKDKSIKSRDDYVFFTGSLADSVAAFDNEIMTEGRPYFDLDGVLRYREKSNREEYCILKIPYRDDGRFYRFDFDDQPKDSIYHVAIAHRGAYDFKKARILEMTDRKVARKEAVNRKKIGGRTLCGIENRRIRKIAAVGLMTGVLLCPHSAFADSLPDDDLLDSLRSGSLPQLMQPEGEGISNFQPGSKSSVIEGSHRVEINPGQHAEIDDSFEYYEDYHIVAHGADGQTASGLVRGSVTAVHESGWPGCTGVTARAETKGSAFVEVLENIYAEGYEGALGISTTAEKRSDRSEVKVGKNVNVTALSPEGVAQGIYTSDGNVVVDGDVLANGKYIAMGVTAMSKNQPSRIMIKGGLFAEGAGVQGAAVSAEDETGDLTFSIGKGGITAVSKGVIGDADIPGIMPISTGLLVSDGSGKVKADIQGDIKASSDMKQSTALWLGGWHSENHGDQLEGTQAVRVHGNLISDDRGIFFVESDYANPTVTDLLVENEIKADKVGIMVYKHHAELLLPKDNERHVDPTNKLNLTAWKINLNKNGNVAEYSTDNVDQVLPEGISPTGADRDFEKKINYIIKTRQPASGGKFKALDANGKALAKSLGYDAAHEGEKVILKADKGYQIVAAYNGNEKKSALSKDKNGNFYLVVPKGGGVYLSAEVKKATTPTVAPKPTSKPTAAPKPTSKPKPAPKPTSKPTAKPAPVKVSGTPIARMTAGRRSLTIDWNKIQGAAGYDIFFTQCKGKKSVCKKIKTIKGNKTFKWTQTGLKRTTPYKAYVKAFVYRNGKKTYVRTSPTIHAYTGNSKGKYTNAKSVTVNRTKVTLKKGKAFKIKAKVHKVNKKKKLMAKGHAPTIRYMTSNKKVAVVSKSGRIIAKGKGTCTIVAFAHNGVSRNIKVTVK